MKSILIASVLLFTNFCLAEETNQYCGPGSKFETNAQVIALVASSEALTMTAGAHRDIYSIEVFSVAEDQALAHINVTYKALHATEPSDPMSFKVTRNCKTGEIELE